MAERIVVLDAGTFGPYRLRRPAFPHDWRQYERSGPEQVRRRLGAATIAITNKVAIGQPELEAAPELKLIAIAATGYDAVDVAAARARGVAVMNVRGYAATTVPEHAFALMLSLRRRLTEYRRALADGAWQAAGQFTLFVDPVYDLAGSTLAIVGAGVTGRRVAAIGRTFGMQVAFLDSHVGDLPDYATALPLPELLAAADVLTLHCPLTDATRNIVDAAAIERMRPTALLINTARGGLVDEPALATAIRDGTIGGAGMDVLSEEPPAEDNPLYRLREHPRLLLTPHSAWGSRDAVTTLAERLLTQIEAFVAGDDVRLLT
ncbi:MAG: NAD(P)-dependent oxidoreductase [Pseudomonadota bacterium]